MSEWVSGEWEQEQMSGQRADVMECRETPEPASPGFALLAPCVSLGSRTTLASRIQPASRLDFRLSLALALPLSCVAARAIAVESTAPLADAVEKLDRAAIRAMLDQKSDVNSRQPDGMTALHWAVHHDDPQTVKLII